MTSSSFYGCNVTVNCDVQIANPYSTYAGFMVLRTEDSAEIARFYEGNPHEDLDTAIAYAKSIASRIDRSPFVDAFFKKIGRTERGVNNNA